MDEETEFEPEQLIDNPFYFNITIETAQIPDNFQQIYVEYSLKNNDYNLENYQTEEVLFISILDQRKN